MQCQPPTTSAADIDERVAHRIRYYRKQQGVKLKALAALLGVSYQQIQKYEDATDKISPGRLYLCAQFFKVPITDFYADLPPATAMSPELRKWIDAFDRISPPARRDIMTLLAHLFDA